MNAEWRARRREADEALAKLSIGLTSFALDVPAAEIAAATRRSAQSAFARQVAMYLCHVAGWLSRSRVAEAFGRDRSTIAYACHAIEDRRDEPSFDSWVSALEHCLRAAPAPNALAPAEGAAP